MTKVVGTQAFPNIVLQDPRQRRQKLGVTRDWLLKCKFIQVLNL